LKKGGWITHLSGRILKPSLHESFVEKYTASLEDIHANHSVQQASDKEKMTQDTYGHPSSSTSGQLDLFGVFGKTFPDIPRWGYGESCPIWKKKVTELRQAYSQRKKLALHTKGNECSSWPTARTSDSIGHSQSKIKRVQNGTMPAGKAQLREWVQPSWATPQASDHIEGARTAKESNQKCLGRDLNQMNGNECHSQQIALEETKMNLGTSAVSVDKIIQSVDALGQLKTDMSTKKLTERCTQEKNWPTPRAGNPGSRKPGTGGKILAEEAKIHNGLQDQEKSNTSGKNQESPKLNPSWVEQLMGLSTGWTDLGSWGMELSPKQQN
jgi:hypothetical protein